MPRIHYTKSTFRSSLFSSRRAWNSLHFMTMDKPALVHSCPLVRCPCFRSTIYVSYSGHSGSWEWPGTGPMFWPIETFLTFSCAPLHCMDLVLHKGLRHFARALRTSRYELVKWELDPSVGIHYTHRTPFHGHSPALVNQIVDTRVDDIDGRDTL